MLVGIGDDVIASFFVGGIFGGNGDIGEVPRHRINDGSKTCRQGAIVPFRDELVRPFQVGKGFSFGLWLLQIKPATFGIEDIRRFDAFVIACPAKRLGPRQGHFLKWLRFAGNELVAANLPDAIAEHLDFRGKCARLEGNVQAFDRLLRPNGAGEDQIATGVSGDQIARECAHFRPKWFGENRPGIGAGRQRIVVAESMGCASDDGADCVGRAGKTGEKRGSERGCVDEVHGRDEASRTTEQEAMVLGDEIQC